MEHLINLILLHHNYDFLFIYFPAFKCYLLFPFLDILWSGFLNVAIEKKFNGLSSGDLVSQSIIQCFIQMFHPDIVGLLQHNWHLHLLKL